MSNIAPITTSGNLQARSVSISTANSSPIPAPGSYQLDSYGSKPGEAQKQAKNATYGAEHRDKVEGRFTPMKRRARAMSYFIEQRAENLTGIEAERALKKANHIKSCRNHLLFRDYYEAGVISLAHMKSCKAHNLCPMCAVARANGYVTTYRDKINELVRRYNQRGETLRFYFVTLTVLHGCDLEQTYNHFSRSVTKLVDLRRDAQKAKRGSSRHNYALNSVMADVVAGAFSIEVKRGSGSGLWHPHTHGVVASTSEIDPRALSAEWKSITGDSYIVDVKEIASDDVKSLCEVFKYALKFSELSLEDNYTAAMFLHGRKLLRSFGEFRGLTPDPDADIDDTTVLDGEVYRELLYSYKQGAYQLEPGTGEVFTHGEEAKPVEIEPATDQALEPVAGEKQPIEPPRKKTFSNAIYTLTVERLPAPIHGENYMPEGVIYHDRGSFITARYSPRDP